MTPDGFDAIPLDGAAIRQTRGLDLTLASGPALMQSERKFGGRGRIPDRSTLTWIVLPVLPLAVVFVLLGLLDQERAVMLADLPGRDSLYKSGLDLRFFNALVSYGGIALFHVAACLVVIVLMSLRLRALPTPERRAGTIAAVGALGLVAVISVIVRSPGLDGALNFAYRYVCAVLVTTDAAKHVLPTDCFGGPLSRLAWMALLPYATGLAAAAVASGVASTAFRPVAATDPEAIQAELTDRARRVEQAFKATSFVLVTATVSLVAFYRLPLAVIEDPVGRDLMNGFGQGLTLVWGVGFTLTLVAIFGTGSVMLNRHLRAEHLKTVGPDLPSVLLPEATRKQIANVVVTLGPLLIGASGSILEQLTAAP